MFVRNRIFRFVIFFAVFGFTMDIIAAIPVDFVHVRSIDDGRIFTISVAGDVRKVTWIDRAVLTEGISVASKNLYGEKIDRVVDVYFTREVIAMGSGGVYWNDGFSYRLMGSNVEYFEVPVKLNLEIDGKIVRVFPVNGR